MHTIIYKMAVYHVSYVEAWGQGGGIADNPSASVVSELQHKLLKHCRGKTILTTESDLLHTANGHKHTQHKRMIRMIREQILVREICRRGGEKRGEGRAQHARRGNKRKWEIQMKMSLEGNGRGREHSWSEGRGSCSSVKYQGRSYKMRYTKKWEQKDTENMTQAS